jgi:hypothetical protein
MIRRHLTTWLAALFLSSIALAACAPVAVYEREQLAHPGIQSPVWPQVSDRDEHVFQIREGVTAVTGRGGGGCGCN